MIDSELAHELILQMISTRMTHRQAIQRILKRNKVGMTFEMLQIMHRLWQTEGVSQQYLAEKTAKDKACLTNLINNLEKKEWVVRREDPLDRRNRLIYLTDEGRGMSTQVMPLLNDIYTQVAKQMSSKQIQASINNLIKLNEILNEI